jgi:hypothetical protein
MRQMTQAMVRRSGWILSLSGTLLPRQEFLNLLCMVAILGITRLGLGCVRTGWPPSVRSSRGLAAAVGGQAAAFCMALYVSLHGLATWLGLTTPGKLIAALLLAAVAGQTLQIDLGFLWWGDPLAQQGALDLAHSPLLHP